MLKIRTIDDVNYFLGLELIKRYNRKQKELAEYYDSIDIPAEVYTGKTIDQLAYIQMDYSERLSAQEAVIAELRELSVKSLWTEVLKSKAEMWEKYPPTTKDWYYYEAVMAVMKQLKEQEEEA